MEANAVEKLWKEYCDIKKFFVENSQGTYVSNYTNTMRKVLILSCGSFFEHEMTEMLKCYVGQITNNNKQLVSFMEKQAIKQKYHTLFDWGKQNDPSNPETKINKFLGLFGEEFKKIVNDDIRNNTEIENAKNAFLELGHIRNILVHSNFANYNFDLKTPEEIYQLYQKAIKFIPYIKEKLDSINDRFIE